MIGLSQPKTVAIVAMGASARTYISLCAQAGDRRRIADETWAINAMGGVIQHDLLFHMDDCLVQEARAEKTPDGCVAGMLPWLQHHPGFFTSKAYSGYPGAVEFPLQEVANSVGSTYLNNTVAYAVAYAIHIGVQKISVYGADYSYPDRHKAEAGRGCVEFLLGIAAARGIHIEVAADSSLLDANVDQRAKPYGYDAYDVEFKQGSRGIEVVKTQREALPTADEIDARYRTAAEAA